MSSILISDGASFTSLIGIMMVASIDSEGAPLSEHRTLTEKKKVREIE